MRCIDIYTDDPFFNLAAEEYLMKHSEEAYFMVYVNSPSVIVGKHQNTLAEINTGFALKHNITIARRVSGGGTVYHDQGNLNFSFITNEEEGDFIKFKKYTRPVIGALQGLGLNAQLGKRNEILLDGLKITGTASHVYKRRVLHHGTLLFNADRAMLSGVLNGSKEKYEDRAVQSVPSKVTNIVRHLEHEMPAGHFNRYIFEFVKSYYDGTPYTFSAQEKEEIVKLAGEKYRSPEWIFSYSPKYTFRNTIIFEGTPCHVSLEVNRGKIEQASVINGAKHLGDIEHSLEGLMHHPEALEPLFKGKAEDWISTMF